VKPKLDHVALKTVYIPGKVVMLFAALPADNSVRLIGEGSCHLRIR
jgi:hypothetical protein